MKFAYTLALAALFLGACSSFKTGKVIQSSNKEIRIAIAHDAANEGVDSFRQASEHCADEDHVAVWYGHDNDGHLVYRCE